MPLLSALGVALRDVEPLSPVLTVYLLVPRAYVSPPLAGAVKPAGLDVAVAPV